MSSTNHDFARNSALAMALLAMFAFAGLARASDAREDAVRINAGAGQFVFVDEKGDATKRMAVYTYLPARLKADTAPIVFVMHGKGKNAKGYRDVWAQHAEARGFMSEVPDAAPRRGSIRGEHHEQEEPQRQRGNEQEYELSRSTR